MSPDTLKAWIAGGVIAGTLILSLSLAALVYFNADAGALAALVGIVTLGWNSVQAIVRNRFPGPEIDVTPPTAPKEDQG